MQMVTIMVQAGSFAAMIHQSSRDPQLFLPMMFSLKVKFKKDRYLNSKMNRLLNPALCSYISVNALCVY